MDRYREYKTFSCDCGYSAHVFGEIQKDYAGTFETQVCLICRILFDGQTATFKFKDLSLENYEFIPIQPVCLNCDESNVMPWDANLCKCPKCEMEMKVTRFELNIDQIGTIKII